MPFDGSGGFQRLMNWTNDKLAAIKIRADRHDEEDNNLAAGLSNCITKDGQTQPTADLPMNGHKLVNMGPPSNPNDSATKAYADSILAPITAVTSTGRLAPFGDGTKADWNLVLQTGWYTGSGDETNAPTDLTGAGKKYTVEVVQLDATHGKQVARDNLLSTDADTMTWERFLVAGVWSAWARTYESQTEINAKIAAAIAAIPVTPVAVPGGGRNALINGRFDIWQRGTSFSAAGFTADRWSLGVGSGSTNSITRGAPNPGDFAGVTPFCLSWARSVAGSTPSQLTNKIEDVRTLAGKLVTVTFWAVGSAASQLLVQLGQQFGTGGSPDVWTTFEPPDPTPPAPALPPEIPITTGWQKFSYKATLPSIAGKTIGAGSSLTLVLTRDAGGTGPLATLFLAKFSVVEGDATAEADPSGVRTVADELEACQRYYEFGSGEVDCLCWTGVAFGGGMSIDAWVPFKATKYKVPTVVITPTMSSQFNSPGTHVETVRGIKHTRTTTGSGGVAGSGEFRSDWTATAEI